MSDEEISAFAAKLRQSPSNDIKKKKKRKRKRVNDCFIENLVEKKRKEICESESFENHVENVCNTEEIESKSPVICNEVNGFSNLEKRKKKQKKKKNLNVSNNHEKPNLKVFNLTPPNFVTSTPINQENVQIPRIKKKQEKRDEGSSNQVFQFDSVKMGEQLFSWLISPIKIHEFFKNFWEKKPLHIIRGKDSFYSEVCTLKDLKNAFKNEDIYFTKNIDVTSYKNGVRVTENPVGKARPSIVWDLYNQGKSIRLLNPQTFMKNVRTLTTVLQDFFRCFVGANMYLTPPNSQGFAPHYDDIEAFVLQIDGKKMWKLYNPRTDEEKLPRESSMNFTDADIGEPILEVTLEPGDLLYFPRGIIHQARCLGERSLHITVSCYQKNSWADLLEKAVPAALQRAIEEDVEFRQGLPLNYLDHLGLVHSDSNSKERQFILQTFQRLLSKLIDYCPIDASADQMGKGFMHDAMPPVITQDDLDTGVNDVKYYKSLKSKLNGYGNKQLGIKLIRAYACRLLSEEDSLKVYFTTHNSLEYHGEEPMYLDVPIEWATMLDCLIKRYPEFTNLQELLSSIGDSDKSDWSSVVDCVLELWRKGLILFDRPMSEI